MRPISLPVKIRIVSGHAFRLAEVLRCESAFRRWAGDWAFTTSCYFFHGLRSDVTTAPEQVSGPPLASRQSPPSELPALPLPP
jgi:hypothetical protein